VTVPDNEVSDLRAIRDVERALGIDPWQGITWKAMMERVASDRTGLAQTMAELVKARNEIAVKDVQLRRLRTVIQAAGVSPELVRAIECDVAPGE
jgi:hypothetical protein